MPNPNPINCHDCDYCEASDGTPYCMQVDLYTHVEVYRKTRTAPRWCPIKQEKHRMKRLIANGGK